MYLPLYDAMIIHQMIPGAQDDGFGGFTVPCTTNASVALTYSGQLFTIDPRDLAIYPVDSNDPQGDCVSGIIGDGTGTQWLVSDILFDTRKINNSIYVGRRYFLEEHLFLH